MSYIGHPFAGHVIIARLSMSISLSILSLIIYPILLSQGWEHILHLMSVCLSCRYLKNFLETLHDYFWKKPRNSRSVVICAEKCWEMESIRIFLKTALRILVILEILMKQMILFQMEVVPCSGKIWIMSYGVILNEPESEFCIIRIILQMAQ